MSGILFVGDLSANDAALLARVSGAASRLLEFGVGGSTQIFARSAPASTTITSVDTDHEWIRRTRAVLRAMECEHRVTFQEYTEWTACNGALADGAPYDVIFDDGIDELRADFAERAWPALAIGGTLLFHDTRRTRDVLNVLNFCARHFLEIDTVDLNAGSSNISIVTKKRAEPYVNWNTVEGRDDLLIGWAPIEATVDFVRTQMQATDATLTREPILAT